MTVFVTLLFILTALLIWLLYAPLECMIDTNHQVYRLRWKSIASMEVLPRAGEWWFRVQVFFWRRQWTLWSILATMRRKEEKKPAPDKPEKGKKTPFNRHYLLAGWSVFRSFRVKQFYLNLDTDNFTTNAMLVPLFYHLSKPNRRLEVNFLGEFGLVLQVYNSFGNMIWAAIRGWRSSGKQLMQIN